MSRLLSWGNLLVGGLLLFALSDIAFSWFSSEVSRLIVFILAVLLIGNAVMLAFGEDEVALGRRH
jgi:hypothetical protein